MGKKNKTVQTSTATVVRRDCLIRLGVVKDSIETAISHIENNEFEEAKRYLIDVDQYLFNAQLNLAYLSA